MALEEALKSLAVAPLAAALGAIAAIGVAGMAHADTPVSDEGVFIASLAAGGITYSDRAQVIATGKMVCASVENGHLSPQLFEALKLHNPDLSTAREKQFVVISIDSFCPQEMAKYAASQ